MWNGSWEERLPAKLKSAFLGSSKRNVWFLLSEDRGHSCPHLLPGAAARPAVTSGFRLFSLWPDPPAASLQVGMFKIHPEIPESMSLEAKAFILRCFEPDPDRRATALDLLTDEFLTVTSRKKKSKGSFTGGDGTQTWNQSCKNRLL